MTRSTLGLALSDAQRFNHYPATPLCSIGWMFEGSTELLPSHAPAEMTQPRVPLPGRITFSGPFTRPSVSWNPGPAHGMMLMLMPDAVQALTGLNPADWIDRFEPLHAVLGPDWQALGDAVLAASDDEQRVALIEGFLLPRWQRQRPQAAAPARLQDWTQALAMRAAASGVGRSLRQAERRIKGWTGLPMRELRGLGRAEQAFFRALAEGDRPVRWSDVAADAGYADQSHLCRETRRITGFPPAELRRRIAEDESFWMYRIWV